MQNTKHSLERSKEAFRKQIKAKLIGKIGGISGAGFGEALYFRPFKQDEKLIEEIAEATGEKKSATGVNRLARQQRKTQISRAGCANGAP